MELKTKEEYQKIMLKSNYKNFDNEVIVLIGYNMYKFIVELSDSFKEDLGVYYSKSEINYKYLFEIRKKYSVFISKIQNLNKEQLVGFVEEILRKFPKTEEELVYYNSLSIINNYVSTYENWVKKEKDLFD